MVREQMIDREYLLRQIEHQETKVNNSRQRLVNRIKLLRQRQVWIRRVLEGDKPIIENSLIKELISILQRQELRLENMLIDYIQGDNIVRTDKIMATSEKSIKFYRDKVDEIIREEGGLM